MDIFITSLTRSGSSLLSNILSNDKKISSFQDPFFEIYKFFYCKLSKEKIIQDYYFSKKKQKIAKLIEKKNFDFISVNKKEHSYLHKKILKRAYNSKELHDIVKYFKGNNIEQYLLSALKLIRKKYKNKIICTKEAWCSELIPHLFQINPKIKIIYLFRDPRAIICSELMYTLNCRKNKKDPIFKPYSIAKHWRKHVSLFHKYKNNPIYKKNICLVRYEDLIQNPKEQLKNLFKFLKLNKKNFKLKLNFNNSNHNNKTRNKITNENVEIWKKKLTTNQINFLETILAFEMKYLNYEKMNNFNENLMFNKKKIFSKFLSKFDYKNELDRLKYIQKNKSFDDLKLERLYLNKNFAKFLKNNFSKYQYN